MEKSLTILLVEDEPSECTAIINYVKLLDDVSLVGVTNNSDKAIEYVKDTLPDAIILDLELHKGGGDGLTFLSNLRKTDLRMFPYILITTNNPSPITHEQARELGADFIMTKGQDNYSAKSVVTFLHSLKKVLHSKARKAGISLDAATAESPDEMQKRLIKRISAELDKVGINPKVVGRTYLSDAILMLIYKPEPHIVTKVAINNKKTENSVLRAMQTAINKAWSKGDIDALSANYTAVINSAKGVPTLTEFIYHYSTKIKNDY